VVYFYKPKQINTKIIDSEFRNSYLSDGEIEGFYYDDLQFIQLLYDEGDFTIGKSKIELT